MAFDLLVSHREKIHICIYLFASEILTYNLISVCDNTKTGIQMHYWCSQDADHKKCSKKSTKENAVYCDTIGMERYNCHSCTTISVCTDLSNTAKVLVRVNIHHKVNHKPYYNVTMPVNTIKTIQSNMGTCKLVDLVPLIQKETLNVTASQIYFAWMKLSKEIWK
ncbi:hypothetical protein GYMLUDRAFT_60820 [Collybiopsis luxurians FD-317 M1]|uniref:Unplaced genomic scaffold GYMLUscaffold_38, whole genome shotgun sequence n=1 Tax=Collybiopsis luxurians FD-317 M1 TaxID=944289 RepID=A0A0D0C6W6_9AGAR|nr:hypothetical protein GYMLUDRAFT_60820 [Collybiopsis luxurians FD-317 M1]